MINVLFTFFTLAFPKTGLVMGGISVTVAELLFLISLFLHFKKNIIFRINIKILVLALIYIFFLSCNLLLNIQDGPLINIFSVLILIVSPFTFFIGKQINIESFAKIVIISIFITTLFAILQKLFGVINTEIQGITVALGDSIKNKPIGLKVDGTALKMPSTYQNGNGWGLFLGLSLPFVVTFIPKDNIWKFLRNISIALAVLGLILSGTRSVLIPFLAVSPLIFIGLMKKSKKHIKFIIPIFFFVVALVILYIFFERPESLTTFYNDYILRTLNDKSGNQRLPQFWNMLSLLNSKNGFEYFKSLILGLPWNELGSLEGIFAIMGYQGILGVPIIYGFWIIPIIYFWKRNRLMAFGFIINIVAWLVDGSFNFPPYLMNYYLFAGVLYKYVGERENEKDSNCDSRAITSSGR